MAKKVKDIPGQGELFGAPLPKPPSPADMTANAELPARPPDALAQIKPLPDAPMPHSPGSERTRSNEVERATYELLKTLREFRDAAQKIVGKALGRTLAVPDDPSQLKAYFSDLRDAIEGEFKRNRFTPWADEMANAQTFLSELNHAVFLERRLSAREFGKFFKEIAGCIIARRLWTSKSEWQRGRTQYMERLYPYAPGESPRESFLVRQSRGDLNLYKSEMICAGAYRLYLALAEERGIAPEKSRHLEALLRAENWGRIKLYFYPNDEKVRDADASTLKRRFVADLVKIVSGRPPTR